MSATRPSVSVSAMATRCRRSRSSCSSSNKFCSPVLWAPKGSTIEEHYRKNVRCLWLPGDKTPGDPVAAANSALHVARQRLGVLAGKPDPSVPGAEHRPEAAHLPGPVDGIAAAGEPLIGPGHRRHVRVRHERRLRLDAGQLAAEDRAAAALTEPGRQ